jgi:hypothetical protein
MPPLAGSDFCWNHSPAHASARAEARKLGGRRRKRASLEGVPGEVPLRTVDDVLCLLERAARDTLTLDNGNDRNRTLASIAGQALTALEKGSFEDRLAALEQAARLTTRRAG